MQLRSILYLLFWICSSTVAQAQSLKYNGSVYDGTQDTSEYLILLKNLEDSSQQFTVVTRAKRFDFISLPQGNYQRCIVFGASQQCDTLQLRNDILADLLLLERTFNLEQITVVARLPFIQNKAGILQINVAQSPLMTSGSLFDLLLKLPGITFNHSDGIFKLNGKSGIQIQQDGQIILFSGNELINFLKSIPAQDVEKVFLDANPSARYDAEGLGGIINFKTKKEKREGTYLGTSFVGTQGFYYKQQIGLKYQFNSKKNVFVVYYNYSMNDNFEQAITQRGFANILTDQKTFAKISGRDHLLDLHWEHKSHIGSIYIGASGTFYRESILQNTNLSFFSSGSAQDSAIHSLQTSKNKLNNLTLSANYNLNKPKYNLSFKNTLLKYDIFNTSQLRLTQINIFPAYPDLNNESPNDAFLFSTQLDLSFPFRSGHVLETGAKWVTQLLDNANRFSKLLGSELIYDPEISNSFDFRENVSAVYTQYSLPFGKQHLVLGARLEASRAKGSSSESNTVIDRFIPSFFPYLNWSYNVTDNHNFSIAISRRITRPRFQNLMPFVYFVDPYTRLIGNSSLRPALASSAEFQYVLFKSYVFSLNYSHTKNQIGQTPIQSNNNRQTLLTPLNLQQIHSFTFGASGSKEWFTWWSTSLNTYLFRDHLLHQVDDVRIDASNLSFQSIFTNSFALPGGFRMEIGAEYISPFLQGAYRTSALYSVNASISKNFLQDKLYTAISGNDLLKSYRIKNTGLIQNQFTKVNQRFDTHWIRLTLAYRFFKGLRKDAEADKSLSQELKSRM